MRVLASLAGLAVLAGAASAETPLTLLKERFVSVVVANGCSMTEAEADKILPGAGFDKDAVGQIVTALMVEDRALVSDEKLVLMTEECS